jgi:TonB family protein
VKLNVRTIVYVRAQVDESQTPELGQIADLYSQSISQRIRRALHGQGEALPRGEPAVTWRTIQSDDALQVTVNREGPAALRIVGPQSQARAASLMLAAARDAMAAGEGTYWPADAQGDSLQFTIGFVVPPPGQVFPLNTNRLAFPAFSVNFPAVTPAAMVTTTSPEYPALARQARAKGTVVVDFEVDSSGSVPVESIRNASPAPNAPETAIAAAASEAFFESVKTWLSTVHFTPAHIGSCAVSQQMRRPITFDVP